jgi:hypothetical protein
MNRRLYLLTALLSVGIAFVTLLSYSQMAEARDSAFKAAEALTQSKQLADAIQAQPAKAVDSNTEELELGRRSEQAATEAGIPLENLLRNAPEKARQVGDSYQETLTLIRLRDVTLPQFGTFVHRLADAESGLQVRSLTLKAPHGEESTDRWTADVTIAYVVYNPAGASNRRPISP